MMTRDEVLQALKTSFKGTMLRDCDHGWDLLAWLDSACRAIGYTWEMGYYAGSGYKLFIAHRMSKLYDNVGDLAIAGTQLLRSALHEDGYL